MTWLSLSDTVSKQKLTKFLQLKAYIWMYGYFLEEHGHLTAIMNNFFEKVEYLVMQEVIILELLAQVK